MFLGSKVNTYTPGRHCKSKECAFLFLEFWVQCTGEIWAFRKWCLQKRKRRRGSVAKMRLSWVERTPRVGLWLVRERAHTHTRWIEYVFLFFSLKFYPVLCPNDGSFTMNSRELVWFVRGLCQPAFLPVAFQFSPVKSSQTIARVFSEDMKWMAFVRLCQTSLRMLTV